MDVKARVCVRAYVSVYVYSSPSAILRAFSTMPINTTCTADRNTFFFLPFCLGHEQRGAVGTGTLGRGKFRIFLLDAAKTGDPSFRLSVFHSMTYPWLLTADLY